MPILILLTSLLISGVAAYYSVIGLATLFAGAFWSVVVMGSALEAGKLVLTSWLYRNWKEVGKLLRVYFCAALFVLMSITSIGIFGYLSKAHLEQNLQQQSIVLEVQQVDSDLNTLTTKLTDLKSVNSIERKAVDKLVEKDPKRALREADKRNLSAKLDTPDTTKLENEIRELNQKKLELTSKSQLLELEVGPIKYVADLIYGQGSTVNYEVAVRYLIVAIIFVFDPLALALLIAANMSLVNARYNFTVMNAEEIKKIFSRKKLAKTKRK